MNNIESLFLVFFSEVINCSYISNKTRVFLACSSPCPSPPPHHHQNAEGSNIFEKNALGRVGILILDGGQLFQRVLRESVKNCRIVGGGVGVKIFKTVGMF